MSEDGSTGVIEFNSMVNILKRIDKITNYINYYQSRGDYKKMHQYLVHYFKDIVADLTVEEEEAIWKKIQDARKYLNYGNNIPVNKRLPLMLDEIDIELRKLAKIHGYLTANKIDPRKKVIG